MTIVVNMVDTDVAEARRRLQVEMADSEFAGYGVDSNTLVLKAEGEGIMCADFNIAIIQIVLYNVI